MEVSNYGGIKYNSGVVYSEVKRVTVTHKKNNKSYFMQYYDKMLSHGYINQNNSNAKKLLCRMRVISVIFWLLYMAYKIKKESQIVIFFTEGNRIIYNLYSFVFLYAAIFVTSYMTYHWISYNYEKKNKHEFSIKTTKGGYSILYWLYVLLILPWVLFVSIFNKVLTILKIQELKQYLPIIFCGQLYFLMIALMLIQFLCKLVNNLIHIYPAMINSVVTEKTYLYVIVLMSIVICRNIPTLVLKLTTYKIIIKNSIEYKKVFSQYHLLNSYFFVVITVILKALDFSNSEKILVDAMFYTSNALALVSTVKNR